MAISSLLGVGDGTRCAAFDTAQGAGANLFDIFVDLDGNDHRTAGRILSRNAAKLV